MRGYGPSGRDCVSGVLGALMVIGQEFSFAWLGIDATCVLRRACRREAALLRQPPAAAQVADALTAFEAIQQRVRTLRRNILDELAVHLQHRRHAAGRQALDAFEREAAVGRRLALLDAQSLFQMSQQRVAPRR